MIKDGNINNLLTFLLKNSTNESSFISVLNPYFIYEGQK